MDRSQKGNIYINGREQVLELLRFLPAEEKAKLLRNMRVRNPALTDELAQESLSFAQINDLSDHEIQMVVRVVEPTVLGIALKTQPIALQRRVLTLVSREVAEKAYQIMMTPLRNEERDSKRAQNKIKALMIELKRRGQIESI